MTFATVFFAGLVWLSATFVGCIIAGRRVRALRYEAVRELRRQRAAQRAARQRDLWTRWREDVA